MNPEAQGNSIEISSDRDHMDMMLKLHDILGSETRFLLSIGSIPKDDSYESSNPWFMHVWINTENLKKFIEQAQQALKTWEERLARWAKDKEEAEKKYGVGS